MIEFRRPYPNELYHYGIKGQHWGERRFQNEDGSLTSAGKERYGSAGAIGRKRTIGADAKSQTIKVGRASGTGTHRRGEGLGSGKVGSGGDRTQGTHAGGGGKDFESVYDKAETEDEMIDAIKRMIKEGGHEAVPLMYGYTAKYALNKKGEPVLEVRDSDGELVGKLNPRTVGENDLKELVKKNQRADNAAFKQRRMMLERDSNEARNFRRSGR